MVLKSRARKVNSNSYVSQRLKRLNSIHAKLVREPAMQLVTMQDIAGCRAILPTLADARNLVSLYETMDIPHEFDHSKDYVGSPKSSGYRSYHLIYRYKSDVRTAYEDMRVEIQIRSALQHAWATALETIDLFTRQALKSSQGKDVLRVEMVPRHHGDSFDRMIVAQALEEGCAILSADGSMAAYEARVIWK
jgi:ppGpp synthetase/RelA/SpoT-type nucleotidyltranferase